MVAKNETKDAKDAAKDESKASKDDAKDAKVKDEEAEVQDAIDEETSQGFRGLEVDQTPNENYTLAGVTADKPTPETDEKLSEKAALARFKESRQRD